MARILSAAAGGRLVPGRAYEAPTHEQLQEMNASVDDKWLMLNAWNFQTGQAIPGTEVSIGYVLRRTKPLRDTWYRDCFLCHTDPYSQRIYIGYISLDGTYVRFNEYY